MTDSARVAFLIRLLGAADIWPNAKSMLADLCSAFGLRAAGLRWPAEGPAVLLADTDPAARLAFQSPVPLARLGCHLRFLIPLGLKLVGKIRRSRRR